MRQGRLARLEARHVAYLLAVLAAVFCGLAAYDHQRSDKTSEFFMSGAMTLIYLFLTLLFLWIAVSDPVKRWWIGWVQFLKELPREVLRKFPRSFF